ncbi:MFS transporter [Aurantimonas sp. MSK8Z-1]|uniref:MFS transporter n=1 Tax=Mangrovibrevibacter kandeliae TaxID=2968473 RepID=UPI0021196471|nr:MFS transporter [Aurantimonas sp. MSK8Z-1]MCW4113402.1 MFS transporter [Aurantimonas sp. MSK8Z-1]
MEQNLRGAQAPGRGFASPHRLAVSAAFLANGFLIGSWAPQIPVLAERLALSKSVLGLLILTFGVGAVIAMPIVGRMIAAGGSRRPMLGCGVLLAFGLQAIALAPGLPLVALAVLFTGAMAGGMDVAMNANAVSLERRLPRAIMSSCHGFWSLGGLFGAGTGGWIIARLGAAEHAALVGLVTLALVTGWVRRGLDDHHAPSAGGIPGEGMETAAAALVSGRAGVLRAVVVGLFALFAMIPEGAVLDWGGVYLQDELDAGTTVTGFAFAAFSLTMASFRFAGDAVRGRLGAVVTARVCSLAAALGLIVAALSPTIELALCGFALMGVGISNMVPIAFSAAGNLPGLKPGIGISVVTTLGYSGTLLAPSLIGVIAEHTGFTPVFLTLACFLLVTFACARIIGVADRITGDA